MAPSSSSTTTINDGGGSGDDDERPRDEKKAMTPHDARREADATVTAVPDTDRDTSADTRERQVELLQQVNLHENERDLLTGTTAPPPLHTPHKRRIMMMVVGIAVATLDLSFLPITYFYALRYGTKLKLQLIFAIITAVYGMISFGHFGLRSMRLFFSRHGSRYKPLGWTRWGMLEFFHLNTLITIALVELELIIATAPEDPILRLCAMPSPTICFYHGILFTSTAIFTMMKWKLPFNMSSTAKGETWRPAIYAYIEDCGAIEARGERTYREKMNARYEASPLFRQMILQLSWFWGIGLICIAILSTVLVFTITEDVAFGLGWGLPYAFMILWALLTIVFVRKSLAREKRVWRNAAAEMTKN